MKVSILFSVLALASPSVLAYSPQSQNKQLKTKSNFSRRAFSISGGSTFAAAAAAALLTDAISSAPVNSFEGSGSTAYSGKNPASALARRKSYQARVTEDVKDFVRLGAAIKRGETDTDPWLFFFSPFERRQPDATGRTYAACADLIGHLEGRELVGGDGYLLASTFTKSGKPPENTPAVKSYNALAKTFEPIKAAGAKGDAAKAKAAWEKSAVLFSKYLEDVDLPGDINDPLYQ